MCKVWFDKFLGNNVESHDDDFDEIDDTPNQGPPHSQETSQKFGFEDEDEAEVEVSKALFDLWDIVHDFINGIFRKMILKGLTRMTLTMMNEKEREKTCLHRNLLLLLFQCLLV